MSQSTALQTIQTNHEIVRKIITTGDLSDLTPEQQVDYLIQLCQRVKLDPLTMPFNLLEITDKETGKKKVVPYANKNCVPQLKKNHDVSVWKVETRIEEGCVIATAYARTPDGREDIDEGAVWIKGLASQNFANARMKAVTKAKRRVTLSICGLGFLDESEIDSIPNAQPLPDPEAEAVMTESEALTLSHRASGLDQWACPRSLAMALISVCKSLEAAGVGEDIWRTWLPSDIQSRKELTEERAQLVSEDLHRRLKLIETCMALGQKGVDKETMRLKLPNGKTSVLDLDSAETQEALKSLTHWLNTYQEVVNNG